MDPGATPKSAGGPLDELRPIARSLVEALRARAALFSLELEEELQRRTRQAILSLLAAVLIYTALLLLTLLVLVLFWDAHRTEAIIAVAALFAAGGVAAGLRLRALRASSPAPFSASLLELHRDLAQAGGAQ